MSELKLNLIDRERILQGTIHGAIVDACVAALSAEPETIAELEAALTRYVGRPDSSRESNMASATNRFGAFSSFRSASAIDAEPWDAGLAVIDLAARVVATESSYSQPQTEGQVLYHDGTQSTDIAVLYRLSDEWKFLKSIAEYESCRLARATERAARTLIDARSVLYGRPLLKFIVTIVHESAILRNEMVTPKLAASPAASIVKKAEAISDSEHINEQPTNDEEAAERAVSAEVSAIHARWLSTSREDLEGQSPRDVLLAKQEFIDFDLHTRELQWTFQGEGPTCLGHDSFAYRFAGFGTHECVVYYDLVRHLIWSALDCKPMWEANDSSDLSEVARLEQIKNDWLENPQEDCGGSVPAIIIENERRRLPLTLSRQDMIIDEDCELCVMSANHAAMGYGPGFWHLDGSHMDDEFAFSFYRTREEWEEECRRREEFDREFNRRWEERQQRLARGEPVDEDFDLGWADPGDLEPLIAASADDDESKLIQ